MCKKILIAVTIVFVVAGMALANTSTVTQVGTGNDATVTQTGTDNNATVNQYGTNLAEIEQAGSTNTAQIDQGAPGSPVTNYHIPGYPTDWWHAAYITQTGNGNLATTNQKDDPTYSHINQTGDGNIGTQIIDTYQSKANGIYSPHRGVQIDQTGNDNEAHQTTAASFGCYGIQDMQILQVGSGNYAQQDSVGGQGCIMEIFHDGDDNSSTQYQWARHSTAHVDILGNNNTTTQFQQYGVWSTSGVHDALIDIIGDGNTAHQSQTGENHYAEIYMEGNDNYASQTQTGTGQSSVISQIGDGNTADVTQGP